MTDSDLSGLEQAIRRAAEESKRYVSSGLPLSPNLVGLLKRFPKLQTLLRVWGTLAPAEQQAELLGAVDIFLRAGFALDRAYRYVAEFASVADLNARGEREQDDASARAAAERRRAFRVIPTSPPSTAP